eukprot:2886653-Rhodomonas_salina.1
MPGYASRVGRVGTVFTAWGAPRTARVCVPRVCRAQGVNIVRCVVAWKGGAAYRVQCTRCATAAALCR